MANTTLTHLKAMKQRGEKIAMLTCYDATFAHTASHAGVDILLIGDSLGMTIQGLENTIPVRLDDMIYHTACVNRGNSGRFIIGDLSFMTYASLEQALESSARLMQAGAHMVKMEGGEWLCEAIMHLTRNGIPVCAHIGLTPQSVNVFGGFKIQGRGEKQAAELIETARKLEIAGAAILVVECVPASLGKAITEAVSVPVIGIGAGADTDGQVLVLHDMLGLSITGRTPKFVKNFMEGASSIQDGIVRYVSAVKDGSFPSSKYSYE
ncbi:uncharacterized protein LOC116347995 [Contarinia nasturtii]|uniref:uncharacterized protein LOC116347995 n=1 Tax=Contarinia nasturtii TaxID=265458 RepID=UPI0012D414AC|nr:uncharacterized protein LOC116347995 [Contarinia nasturtii]XP_031634696.1 uncharacterized protein LOC116347995 [Contarinia nasturtii]XP_031634697.1 uncharacterized protein LOC116347995 [Contarinia nasturtii]